MGALDRVTDTREGIVLVTLNKDDEGEPFSPDLDLERAFDARITTRSTSDTHTTASPVVQAQRNLDRSTNQKLETQIPRHTRFLHLMNRFFTGFFDAVEQGDLERVKELLTITGLKVNCRNGEKQTALHLAACSGKRDVAELLFERGAIIEAKDFKGRTALFCAALEGHSGLVELLLDKGTDMRSKNNRVPVDCATSSSLQRSH